MEVSTIELFQAADATESYAIRLVDDASRGWRAQRGFGQDHKKIWTVELQSENKPEYAMVDWDAVLERVLEAASLNDPVLTNFQWPVLETSK